MRKTLIATAVMVALAVSGCAQDKTGTSTQSNAPTTTTAQPQATTDQGSSGSCPSAQDFSVALRYWGGWVGGTAEVVKINSDIACEGNIAAAWVRNRQKLKGEETVTDNVFVIRRRDWRLREVNQPVTDADKRWEVFMGPAATAAPLKGEYCTPEYLPTKVLEWVQAQHICAS